MRPPMRPLPLVLLPLLAGCAGTPTLSAMHDPLYRAQAHRSTITARATESRDGISEIAIRATVGELTACDEGNGWNVFPSLVPCRRNAFSVTATCAFAASKVAVTCALPIETGDRRMISYEASTRSAGGRTATTGPVTYAAGAPVTQARMRIAFADIVLPWETARPVIWRTATPGRDDARGDRIDVGYVPNSDYASYRQFTDDLQPLALAVFYTDTNPFSSWTRTFRNIFNLWAGPAGTSASGCTRNFDATTDRVRGAFDGTTILHRNAFRDCASISLGGGAGTTETTETDAAWLWVHEAGHYLFGLGDEYDGGGNAAVSDPRNVFATLAACQSASTTHGLPSGQCAQIGGTGTFRNDDGQATTMEDRVLTSDWRTLSSKAMGNLLSACVSDGACY